MLLVPRLKTAARNAAAFLPQCHLTFRATAKAQLLRGRSPERTRPLAFALGYSRGNAAAKTDNRREAAAEGRERGSDNFLFWRKPENGVQSDGW